MWNKTERLQAVLSGELADRPPVSGWRHFLEKEHGMPQEYVDAMLAFQHKYNWDYMKLQPRATYYDEAWGGELDYSDYRGGVVAPYIKAPINCMEDLEKITELSGTVAPFAEQLDAVRLIQEGIGDDTPIFQTIFCPTSILQKMCAVDSIGRYRPATRSDLMVTMMKEHPEQVHRALKNITRTLAAYSRELMKLHPFGVFYAATGLSRTGYLTRAEWEEFVRPYDMQLLEALQPCEIMIHACGIRCNPEWFANYPISILHWPESAIGNPSLDSAPGWLNKITPMGGVDERLFGHNQVEEIARLTRNTLKKMKNIPFMLAPDCSLSIHTSHEEIMSFINAAHETV